MKIGIVSTFSDRGYYEYGKVFVDSLQKYVDKNISVLLYTDSITFDVDKNFKIFNLENEVPELTQFKERNKNRTVDSFINDAVRFSHKSFCLYHSALNSNVDILIWLDADTEIYNNITQDYLLSFIKEGSFVSYLGRPNYTETGFLAFDLRNSNSIGFFEKFKSYYTTDKIYELSGQLDCHVFDATRLEFEKANLTTNYNISPEGVKKHHFNNVFNGYMIHYKGDRKQNKEKELNKVLGTK